MKKKLQIVSLLFLLLTSVLSAQDFTVGNFKYTVLSGTNVRLTGYVTKPTGSLTISGTVTNSSITYTVTSIGDYSFSNCSGLTHVSIPNSVTNIGNGIFSNCLGITTVSIPSSVTSIGDYAFIGCSGLTSISFPNSVTSIGNYAFFRCYSLSSVSFPNSVTIFGNNVFEDCSGLTSVNVSWSTPFVISFSVFYNLPLNTINLNVPIGTSSLYKSALVWKDFKSINDATLSTNSYSLNNNLQLYPNPAKEYVSISGLEDQENYSIYSILGTKMSAGSIAKDQKIDTQNLAPGTYFIKFEKGNSLKFIKE